jgi:O-antigen ligase
VSLAAAAQAKPAARDRLGLWCGWVMIGAAVLVPLLAWLAPRGFAPLLALMGLFCLPALRITDEDRPVLIVLLGALIWAAVTTTWSPYHPKGIERSVILQLALGLPLFWSAVCGARRADPRLNTLALRVLAWGLALFGAELIVETATGAGVFRWLHESYYQPIRVDLAQGKIAHSTSVLAVLWPAVLVGRFRRLREVGLLVAAVAGTVMAAHAFQADAAVLAFPLASAAMLVVWLWPKVGPRAMAAAVASLSFLMPGLIWAVRAMGNYTQLEQHMPFTWAARMSYWSFTIDRIGQQPMWGWGLDASRVVGTIALHPHNGALQVWLELGLPGAVSASAFWGLNLYRLSREEPNVEMTGVAGSVAAFLLFAWVSFGLWQQWWLAVGALIPVIAAMLHNRDDIGEMA